MTAGRLPDRFRRQLAALSPDWAERRFLAACSGGLDSTALIHLAALALPPDRLAAAHLNHGLRGPAADDDQRLAAETAAALGLDFITEKRDVAALARRRRKGLEEAARRARYDFLQKAAEDFGADFVITAHQADDQAETMLLNLIKGAGPGGLAGIHPRRPLAREKEPGGRTVELLRPLLSFTRAELRAWLVEGGLTWAEDLTNDDPRHRRNLIRRDLLPRLAQINPRLVPALARTAEVMRGEEDFWRLHLAKLWPQVVLAEETAALTLSRRALAALTPAERRRLIYEAMLRIWLARPNPPEPLTFASVETALSLLDAPRPGGLDLPGGLRAEAGADQLRLSPASRLSRKSGRGTDKPSAEST